MSEHTRLTVYEAEALIAGHNCRTLVTSVACELLPFSGQDFVISELLVKSAPSDSLIAGLLACASEILRLAGDKTLIGKEIYEVNKERISVYMQCPHATISGTDHMRTAEISEAISVIRAQREEMIYRTLYRLVSAFEDIVIIDGAAMSLYERSGLSYLVTAATQCLPPMTSYRTYSHLVDTRRPTAFTTMQLFIQRQGGPLPNSRDEMFEICADFAPNEKAVSIQSGVPARAPSSALLN